MSGYVLCEDGTAALATFEDERVRFAASLDDTSGIVAFDGDADPAWSTIGTVFTVQAFVHPFFTPKRARATGNEHYTLLPLSFADYLREQEFVTGVAQITDTLLLVESDGPIAAGDIWTAGVESYRDKRLELVSA